MNENTTINNVTENTVATPETTPTFKAAMKDIGKVSLISAGTYGAIYGVTKFVKWIMKKNETKKSQQNKEEAPAEKVSGTVEG